MVRFGVSLWQEEFDLQGLKEAWRKIEDTGYDSAWLYDHFFPMSSQTSGYILEPWTTLPSLAAETRRLRLGVLVTCNSFRYPSVLAKVAASVDVMIGGRLEFGIGAGWYEDEYIAYGILFPDAKTRIEQLAESVELIKTIWTQDKASFRGKHYTVTDLVSYPKPLQKPHPPVWIGGKGDKILRIAAQHADYVNFAGGSVQEFNQRLEVLKTQCVRAGRSFDEIGKTWNGFMIIGQKEEARRKALRLKQGLANKRSREMSDEEFINRITAGPPEECVDQIQRYVDLGVTYFIPHFPFDQDLRTLEIFMDKVLPAFKRH